MSYPLDHVLCESTHSPFLKVIAAVLNAVVRKGRDRGTPVSEFDARVQPTISLHDYLKRWVRYTRCGAVSVVAAVMYIDRVCMKNGLMVTPMNVHRFLLAGLLVASKYCHDVPFRNSHYATVGGVALDELNALECKFLSRMEFDAGIATKDLDGYLNMFRNHKKWPAEAAAEEAVQQVGPSGRRRSSVTSSGNTDNGISDCPTPGPSDRRSSISTEPDFPVN